MAYCGGRDRDCPEVETHVDETRPKTFLEGQLGFLRAFRQQEIETNGGSTGEDGAGEQDLDWGLGSH